MASSANLRDAASAASRASALSSQACAGARSASGSVFELAPCLDKVVAQRRRRHPRDDGTAIVADPVSALDADQL